jgi:glycerophosphoryl diester phosphodiesterase
VLWIAHAGLSADLPAGAPTAARLTEVRALGLERVELDVARTGSGELVVIHDFEVARGERVDAGSLADLRRRLPELLTLAEAVEVLEGQGLLLDLKGDVAFALSSWLSAHPAVWPRTAVCTDDLRALLILQYAAPKVERWRTLPMIGEQRGERRRRAFAVATRRRLPGLLPHLVREVAAAGLCCDRLVVTHALCDAAHRLRTPVAAWTVDRAATARRVAAAGVGVITTNAPDAMKAALERA